MAKRSNERSPGNHDSASLISNPDASHFISVVEYLIIEEPKVFGNLTNQLSIDIGLCYLHVEVEESLSLLQVG